jgi:hypothetical protein
VADALAELGTDASVLVWWGNPHHATLIGDDWVPMAMRFPELR